MASIHFSCPNCHTKLSAEREQFGTPATCPECEWSFYVPQISEEENGDALVKFFCPHCNRKLSATRDQFATEMPCPFKDCRKPVLVPSPEWKPLPTGILKRGPADAKGLVEKGEEINRGGLSKED
ncbi:MAG: hypothetical protein KDM64_17095 [Verrucomicrobiae bacterium]|nr:hypothetical protein [Verrucomicrobiae bacterium]